VRGSFVVDLDVLSFEHGWWTLQASQTQLEELHQKLIALTGGNTLPSLPDLSEMEQTDVNEWEYESRLSSLLTEYFVKVLTEPQLRAPITDFLVTSRKWSRSSNKPEAPLCLLEHVQLRRGGMLNGTFVLDIDVFCDSPKYCGEMRVWTVRADATTLEALHATLLMVPGGDRLSPLPALAEEGYFAPYKGEKGDWEGTLELRASLEEYWRQALRRAWVRPLLTRFLCRDRRYLRAQDVPPAVRDDASLLTEVHGRTEAVRDGLFCFELDVRCSKQWWSVTCDAFSFEALRTLSLSLPGGDLIACPGEALWTARAQEDDDDRESVLLFLSEQEELRVQLVRFLQDALDKSWLRAAVCDFLFTKRFDIRQGRKSTRTPTVVAAQSASSEVPKEWNSSSPRADGGAATLKRNFEVIKPQQQPQQVIILKT
jgi:hypothetical protein